MRRLAAQNLAEEQPSRLVQWLFYSHPPIRERIAAAQMFKGSDFAGAAGAAGGGPPCSCSSALRLRRILPVGSMLITLTSDLFAFLQLVAHVLDAVVRDFRDVQQAVGARHDLDERAEVGDALHLAEVGLVQLRRRRQLLDDRDRLLRRRRRPPTPRSRGHRLRRRSSRPSAR